MWRLIPNNENKYIIDSEHCIDNFRFSFNNYSLDNVFSKLKSKYSKKLILPCIFDNPNIFRSNNFSKIEAIKLSNNKDYLISIHEDKMLQYWSCSKLFDNTHNAENSNNIKKCSQCNNTQTNVNYTNCLQCLKRICSNCKQEEIIPEISLKSKINICYDCYGSSYCTNNSLYD